MTLISASFLRDANGVPLRNSFDTFVTKITRAYTGAATLGAVGTTNIFTITGIVYVRAMGVCTEDLVSAGGGTISVGVTSTAGAAASVSALIATTTATTIDSGEAWNDTSPANGALFSANVRVCAAGNITEVIATGDITDGTIDLYILWSPFTSAGNIVAV